jgi:transcriptional regulator GlxA family with amidase domain
MFGTSPPRLPQPITLFLLPKFSMMGFASAIEPLRSANRMSGRALYTWHILSKDGAPVIASNGIPVVPEAGIEKVERCETLILCGGLDVHLYRDKSVFAWLRRLDRQGADIGAISTAAMPWRAPGC